MERTIEITAGNDDRYTEIEEAVGVDKLQAALGRLATWGLTRYPHVSIYLDHRDLELVACYYRADQKPGQERPAYVIGAVWHGDHFGFHS